MPNYALIKDGTVINTVLWAGPDVEPMDFGDGVTYIEYADNAVIQTGCTYDTSTKLFSCSVKNYMTGDTISWTTDVDGNYTDTSS